MDIKNSMDFVKSFEQYENENDSIVSIGGDIFAIVNGESIGPFNTRIEAIKKSVEARQKKIDNIIHSVNM